MKKIIFLTHHFPPYNSIASLRPYSWCLALAKHYEVIVITKNWGVDLTADRINNLTIHQVESRIVNVNYLKILQQLVKGNFQAKEIFEDNYFNKACKIIEQNKIDLIIVTALPAELIKVAYRLKLKYNIPFSADIRDFWFMFLHKSSLSFKEKMMTMLFSPLVKKWVKESSLVTGVSYKIVDYFNHTNKKVIYNGFTPKLHGIELPKPEYKKYFNISCIGQIYPHQDISNLMVVFKRLQEKYDKIVINFIGLPISEHRRVLEYNLKNIFITDRLPQAESDKYFYNSQMLFYNAWKGWKGIYSGKIFEYLGSHKNIIVSPSDDDVVAKLIDETKSGLVSDSITELYNFIETKFREWENTDEVSYNGDKNQIDFYRRDKQALFFLIEIKKLLNDKDVNVI